MFAAPAPAAPFSPRGPRPAALAHAAAALWLCAATAGCSDPGREAVDASASVDGDASVDRVWPWLAVIDTMGFTRQKPIGVAPGFDLDGKVTTKPEAASCKKLDLTSPDGTPGIDNEFAKLVPLIEQSGIGALEGLIQSTINDGGIMLMMQIDGLDDEVNDPDITLRVRAGKGVPLLGTDGLLIAGQTFQLHQDSPEVQGKGHIAGGVVLAGPFDILLPLVVFGVRYDLDVRGVFVRARLEGRGRLVEGIFGGAVTMASILDIAQKGAADQKNLVELVTAVVGGAGDLDPDPKTGECTKLSAVLAFTSVNGFLFEDTGRSPRPTP